MANPIKRSSFITRDSTTDAPLQGMRQVGNIPLQGRPLVPVDGSYGTIRSENAGIAEGEVLYPTIYDGKVNEGDAPYDRMRATGKNLGIFSSPQMAEQAARYFSQSQGNNYDSLAAEQSLEKYMRANGIPQN